MIIQNDSANKMSFQISGKSLPGLRLVLGEWPGMAGRLAVTVGKQLRKTPPCGIGAFKAGTAVNVPTFARTP